MSGRARSSASEPCNELLNGIGEGACLPVLIFISGSTAVRKPGVPRCIPFHQGIFHRGEGVLVTPLARAPARVIDYPFRAGPWPPPAAIAVVDRVLRVRPTTVVDLRPETPTLVSV